MTTGRYDSRLTQWLGISEIDPALPPVVGSAETGGKISKEAAAITGLAAGTPVVGGLFDVVSTALCAGIDDEFTLNAVMGTWAVTSGIARGLRDHEAHPYVYGRYVNDGQYIVHEASQRLPAISNGLPSSGATSLLMRSTKPSPACPKAVATSFFCPFSTAVMPGWK
nr:L-xylulose/3-keto-L-gulonate kinase [Salmonella sp. NCTC 7297]